MTIGKQRGGEGAHSKEARFPRIQDTPTLSTGFREGHPGIQTRASTAQEQGSALTTGRVQCHLTTRDTVIMHPLAPLHRCSWMPPASPHYSMAVVSGLGLWVIAPPSCYLAHPLLAEPHGFSQLQHPGTNQPIRPQPCCSVCSLGNIDGWRQTLS